MVTCAMIFGVCEKRFQGYSKATHDTHDTGVFLMFPIFLMFLMFTI